MPKNGPQEKQFLKGISESTTNWHKCIKAAKVVIASRVIQSLLNKFYETIIIDYKINIVYCIKVSAISNVYSANHNKNQSSYQDNL